jgi:hypothetical protein
MKKLLFPLFFLLLVFLTGCGAASAIDGKYPLENVVTGELGNESKIYRAYGTTVSKVADEINEMEPAENISEEKEGKKLLLYNSHLVQLMQDKDVPEDVLIEVSSREFVQNNYGPSFFELYGMMAIADDVLDLDDAFKNKKKNGYYTGYINSSGSYSKNASSSGSIRFGSTTSSSNVRGGGPGAGK